MIPVLALLCDQNLKSSDDVKNCMGRLASIPPSSYAAQMEAQERTHAVAIDSGRLTLYEMDDLRGDLCARLPQRECMDQISAKGSECAWSDVGSDSSPEPICGALFKPGSKKSTPWTSHVGDDHREYPAFLREQRSSSPSILQRSVGMHLKIKKKYFFEFVSYCIAACVIPLEAIRGVSPRLPKGDG